MLFDANLAALAVTSPAAAKRVSAAMVDASLAVVPAASGELVIERAGRPLDSRRDPAGAAGRLADAVDAKQVVLAGFGTGYLPEALRRRGIEVTVVESAPAVLAAAMCARDLRVLFADVRVVIAESLKDAVELAALRARAPVIVPHGPSVAASPELRALVDAWPAIRVARRPPKVLVVGPIYGGSLELARSTADACRTCGADTQLFDASVFADSHHAFGGLAVPSVERAGFQNAFANLLGDAVVRVAIEWRADLILALAQAPLGEPALTALRTAGVRTAFWFVENSRILPYWRTVAPHYDWFYAIQGGRFLEQLAEAGAPHARYLPVACDPARHVPLALTPEERARYQSDVSFAGAAYLNRLRVLPAIADLGLRVWGPGWREPALAHCVAGEGKRFSFDEMIKIFCASRINVNLHSANHVDGLDPEPDYVNPRTFELAACESFQLVDCRDPLPELFRSDEVARFATVAELRELVRYYLARDDERVQMAARARKRALAEHTYADRVRRIFRDALAPELAAAALTGVKAESLEAAIAGMERGSAALSRDEAVLRVVHEVSSAWKSR